MSVNEESLQMEYLRRIAEGVEALVAILNSGGVETIKMGEHIPETDPDYLAAIAAEVEGRIQGSSTPAVRREVELKTVTEEEETPSTQINLYKQTRKSLEELTKIAPKDILIEEANSPESTKLFIAALEIVYSNMPIALWGTDRTKEAIAELIALHSDHA